MKSPLKPHFLLVLLSSFLLASCSEKGPQNTLLKGPISSPTSDIGTGGGTSDRGGGGNLIQGKPIDSYVVDITQFEEYKNLIQPMDQFINETTFREVEFKLLKAAAKRMTWYLVPVELDELPKEKINTPFSSIQGARQYEKEIFLSQPILDQMTSEDRATLILHELVMVLFRVQFDEFEFYCGAFGDEKNRNECLSDLLKSGDEESLAAREQKEFLTESQYSSIRNMTKWLLNHRESFDRNEFIQKMIDQGFDARMFNASSLDSGDKRAELTRDQLRQMVDRQMRTGKMPKYCGFTESQPMTAKQQCLVTMLERDGKFIVSMALIEADSSTGQKLELVFTRGLQIPVAEKVFKSGLKIKSIRLSEVSDLKDLTIDRYYLDVLISDVESDLPEIEGMVLTKRYGRPQSDSAGFILEKVVLEKDQQAFDLIYFKESLPIFKSEFDSRF